MCFLGKELHTAGRCTQKPFSSKCVLCVSWNDSAFRLIKYTSKCRIHTRIAWLLKCGEDRHCCFPMQHTTEIEELLTADKNSRWLCNCSSDIWWNKSNKTLKKCFHLKLAVVFQSWSYMRHLELDAFYNFLLVQEQYCELMSVHYITLLYTNYQNRALQL